MFRKPVFNTLVQIAGKGLTVLSGLVTTAILIRGLGVDGYGFYILIGSSFLLLDSLADFGSKIIGVRELAAGRRKRLWVWRDIFWLRVLMTMVAFGAGLVLVMFWPGLRQVRVAAVVALLMLWPTMVAGCLEIVWQWKLKMGMKVITNVLFSGLFLGLIWVGRDKINLLSVYMWALIARGLSLVVGGRLLWRDWKFDVRKFFEVKKAKVRQLWFDCWPMGVYLLVFTSYDRAVDSLMIDRWLGMEAVAWYGLAYKIYAVLIQPAYFFTASIFPLMTRQQSLRSSFGGQARGKSKRILIRSMGLLMVGLLVLIPTAYHLSPWVVKVLAGDGFGASVDILRILLMALVFSYLNHLVGFGLISKGGQKQMLWLGLISLSFNFVANWWTIPRFGIRGAAIVTVLTEGLSLGLVSAKLGRVKKA